MALPYTDGNIIASSFTALLTTKNVTYIFNSASLDKPGATVERSDQNGTPVAAYHYQSGVPTGSAEIQVNASGDQGDLTGDVFMTDAFTGSNLNFVITSQSMPVSKGDARVYNITYAQKLN